MQNQAQTNTKGITVIMPTYNQGAFISRAISSLLLQSYENWELIIINDGSTDYTHQVLADYFQDSRISYYQNKVNEGIGSCMNKGLEAAVYDLIAYLPSDDIYFKDHLASLLTSISANDAVLAYSGMVHHYLDLAASSAPLRAEGLVWGESLQLVQVLHRKTTDRWLERDELVTDSLNEMFWKRLGDKGLFQYSGKITCEWVDHPAQHHKIIRETTGGGIYLYKQYYQIAQPLRYRSSVGNLIDERAEFSKFQKPASPKKKDSLKILLVGELAYNPERICALEEFGHQLYALWIPSPAHYTTTGPLPFGNVTTLSHDDLAGQLRQIKPDIIYALLNQQAVPLANFVMRSGFDIPFVWHFKEGPFVCRQNGTWDSLIELYANADGRIFTNPETRDWFGQFIKKNDDNTFLLDGDLPKKEWFEGSGSPLLSEQDGEIHTLVSGRPYGLTADHIKALGEEKIHLHFYGNIQHTYWQNFIDAYTRYAPGYLHLHPQCSPAGWIKEFSRYDAGWLHVFDSSNNGEYMKATWPDLNYPARLSTFAAAGLPMIMKNNPGQVVAVQALAERTGTGIYFNTIPELANTLRDSKQMKVLRMNVQKHRMDFCFDSHAQELTSFFRKIISACRNSVSQGHPVIQEDKLSSAS